MLAGLGSRVGLSTDRLEFLCAEVLVIGLCARFVKTRPLVRFELMVQIADHLEIGLSGCRIEVATASKSGLFAPRNAGSCCSC